MEFEEGLFSRDRKRKLCIYSINIDWLMGMYPKFNSDDDVILRIADDKDKKYTILNVTSDDHRIMHKYICLSEGKATDYWRTFSIPTGLSLKEQAFKKYKRFLNLNILGSTSALKPQEYERLLKLSRHIVIESESDRLKSPPKETCNCGSGVGCLNVEDKYTYIEKIQRKEMRVEDKGKKSFSKKLYSIVSDIAFAIVSISLACWVSCSCYFSIQEKRASLAEIHARTEVIKEVGRATKS